MPQGGVRQGGLGGGSAVEPKLFVGISEGAGISSSRGPPPHQT